jgi:hypothetical protein
MLLRVVVALVLSIALAAGLFAVLRATSPTVDSIPCETSEQLTYHVHAYLSIVDRGKVTHPPASVGINLTHLCLFWVHTHDDSGIIHIEAPHRITPTLGQFFAVWGKKLSRTQVGDIAVSPAQKLRAYVGKKPYNGDPNSIILRDHEAITIEIGPPFRPPVTGHYPQVQPTPAG